MDFTNYLANKLISATVRAIPFTTPVNVYLALFTTDPTKEAVGDEVEAESYNRQPITMTEPEDGVSANASQIDFSVATGNWGNVGWVGIFDQEVAGNLMYFTALDNSKEILTGDQFRVDVDKLNLQLT